MIENFIKNKKYLEKNYAYDPNMEHDACGVGLIASLDGKKSRKVVEYGIEALKAVWHRGAVDADGNIIYEAEQFSEEIFSFDLELEIKNVKSENKLIVNEKKSDLAPLKTSDSLSELESMYAALKMGLSDYVEKNIFKKVLVGPSGGIDSALTATIAVDALTSDNVIGVAMPSKFNPKSSLHSSITQ